MNPSVGGHRPGGPEEDPTGGLNALKRVHARYDELGLPPAHLPARRGTLSTLTDARANELRAEFEEVQPELVITLGNEPIKVLAFGEPLRPETYGDD